MSFHRILDQVFDAIDFNRQILKYEDQFCKMKKIRGIKLQSSLKLK